MLSLLQNLGFLFSILWKTLSNMYIISYYEKGFNFKFIFNRYRTMHTFLFFMLLLLDRGRGLSTDGVQLVKECLSQTSRGHGEVISVSQHSARLYLHRAWGCTVWVTECRPYGCPTLGCRCPPLSCWGSPGHCLRGHAGFPGLLYFAFGLVTLCQWARYASNSLHAGLGHWGTTWQSTRGVSPLAKMVAEGSSYTKHEQS